MGGDDSTPPPPLLGAPEKPTVTSGDKQLAVSWTAVEGATAYEVWYALAPDAESPPPDPATAIRYVEAISALSLVITGLDNETFYNVWIKAKNAETTSDFSEAAKENPVTPTPLEPPPAPEILDPQPEGASIRVQWTAVPQADGYEVYYIGGAALPGTAPAQVTGGGADSALVSDLDADTIYYVWVRARNAAGVSEDSAVKSCATHKSEKAITAFTVGNSPGTINETDKTIHVLVPFAADLQQAAPQITLSPAATVSPVSGTPVDFSAGPQDFTVTAQNGTTQVYRVTVAKNAWYSFTLAWT
ncbi:MAG: fibronectin type III domain-containing protein, partial [Treponema sp.]|nr:fibronectin type III domain-containing protein [Treponema sp.]